MLSLVPVRCDPPPLVYPFHDRDAIVAPAGTISQHGRVVAIYAVLEGQRPGLREVDAEIWLVSFMLFDLGYIDLEVRTQEATDISFGSKALTVRSEQSVVHLLGLERRLRA